MDDEEDVEDDDEEEEEDGHERLEDVTLSSLRLEGNTNVSQALKAEIYSMFSEENLEKRRQEKVLLALLLSG